MNLSEPPCIFEAEEVKMVGSLDLENPLKISIFSVESLSRLLIVRSSSSCTAL